MDDYVKADSGLVQEFKPVISFFYWQDQENSGQHRVIVRDEHLIGGGWGRNLTKRFLDL